MRIALRALALVFVFAGVGWLTARGVMRHVADRGTMQPEVRLAGAMAGLFAGGAATVISVIVMAWTRGKT